MDRLPEEIVANIISHVIAGNPSKDSDSPPAPPLAQYATVSRRWQPHIESETFANITLTPERLSSPVAAQALTPDRVRRYVRFIRLNAVLPSYDVEARARRETDDEKAANDAVFTDFVQKAFAFLSSVAPAVPADPKIRLDLEAYSPSDREDIGGRSYRRHMERPRPKDILRERYETSYLDLRQLPGTSLPTLHSISHFHIGSGSRHFIPNVLCLIASKIPGLQEVHWELDDNERRDTTFRKKLRDGERGFSSFFSHPKGIKTLNKDGKYTDLATGLRTLPSTLQSFVLIYHQRTPLDHSFQRPSLLNEQGQDELSLSLYALSQRLVDFNIMAEVGPEVFGLSGSAGPESQEEQLRRNEVDSWPFMKDYSIIPGFIAPSGKWRFLRDPNLSDSDEEDPYDSDDAEPDCPPGDKHDNQFRTEPDPGELNFLLLSFARAAGRMPALEQACFALHAPVGITSPEVWYWPDGYRPQAGAAARAPKLAVLSEPVFHPAEEVIQVWREVAKKHRGKGSELEVVIKDGWYDI